MVVPGYQIGEKLLGAWFKTNLISSQEEKIRNKAINVIEFLNLKHLSQEIAGNLSGGQKKKNSGFLSGPKTHPLAL